MDALLVLAAQQGDATAFRDLVLAVRPRLVHRLMCVFRDAHWVEDALQEALIRAWRHLPHLKEVNLFEHWLYRIAHREALRRYRNEKLRHGCGSLDAMEEEGQTYESPHEWGTPQALMEAHRVSEALKKGFERLSEDHKAVLMRYERHGVSYEDIAKEWGVPVGTVRSRLHRARKAWAKAVSRDAGATDP
jgi:RNA polymerase sigma-70 factor, ECF subfamily